MVWEFCSLCKSRIMDGRIILISLCLDSVIGLLVLMMVNWIVFLLNSGRRTD